MKPQIPIPQWLEARYPEVTPRDFYREIFPDGALQNKGEYVSGTYTGIILAVGKDQNGVSTVRRYTLTNDLDLLDTLTASNDFCICSPLTYAGKSRTADHARYAYAIAVDIDKILYAGGYPLGLENLLDRHVGILKRLPQPTFIVSSGNGIHVYFVLDKPIPLYPERAHALQSFKWELTRMLWHDAIVNIQTPNEIQQEGIYQGFRMPGTITKSGSRARAFKTGERVTMEYLNGFVESAFRVGAAATADKKRAKGKVSLETARKRWPDWYERRVVNGEPPRPAPAWNTNRRVYEWWKHRILTGATVGHRYFCLMMLAVYAQKCSRYDPKHNPDPVTREQLEADAFALLPFMESMTDNENNHFDRGDVLDALEAYDQRFIRYPRDVIAYRTAITIEANKRNGRTQKLHLRIARNTLDILNETDGSTRQGRKSKAAEVAAWRAEHPDGTKADCIRDTGMDKKTVYKHWDADPPPDQTPTR